MVKTELEMVDIDLEIKLEDVTLADDVSVPEILQTSITKDRGFEFDFNRSTLCEDFPCCSHSLYLVATTDLKKGAVIWLRFFF